AALDKEAAKRERERKTTFDQSVQSTFADIEKRSRELVSKIEDRTERIRLERESQRQIAEMKRTAERGVRIVRESQPVQAEPERAAVVEIPEYVTVAPREIVVGDKVKLRSFGSVGIVDQIKDGIAEVRVKSLRFKERLDQLELVEQQPAPKGQQGKLEKLRKSANTELRRADAEQS